MNESLFSNNVKRPLADRLRPTKLEDVGGNINIINNAEIKTVINPSFSPLQDFESFALHGLSTVHHSHRRLNQVAIISEIVFCQNHQKTQAILCVLTSIFSVSGGETATENRDRDLISDYIEKDSVPMIRDEVEYSAVPPLFLPEQTLLHPLTEVNRHNLLTSAVLLQSELLQPCA